MADIPLIGPQWHSRGLFQSIGDRMVSPVTPLRAHVGGQLRVGPAVSFISGGMPYRWAVWVSASSLVFYIVCPKNFVMTEAHVVEKFAPYW